MKNIDKIFCLVFFFSILIFTQENQKIDPVQDPNPKQDEWVDPASVVHSQQQLEKQRQDAQKAIQAAQEKMKQESPQMKARIEEQQRIRAQRTAKYKAEQERIKELRRKQKEAAEKRKQEMGGGQERNFDTDGKLQRTAEKKSQERKQTQQRARSYKNRVSLKSIMFEVGKKIQQFIINPSLDDEMMIRFRLYVEKDNVFSQIKDIETQEPLKVYIYEDNNRIVSQANFFFEQVLAFPVKASSVYTLRFYNSGSLKLVSMDYNHFISSETAKKFYDAQKGEIQFTKAFNLIEQIKSSIKELETSKAIDTTNRYVLAEAMDKHYTFQIIEIIIVSAVCLIQVKFIKKMFKSVSIL